MLRPVEQYKQDLLRDDFQHDPAQEQAVKLLDDLYERLVKRYAEGSGLSAKLARWFGNKEPEQGLYFWGGVGRGKTYLVDTFFDSLPFEQKKRLHFHRFMHKVHHQLKQRKGEKNPLDKIAADMAEGTYVICFDEFFVSDITDAMLLAGLFKELFKHGVTLVATSNIPPEKLYWNGLQRDRFLPAIDLIQRYTNVVNVDGGVDYRLRTLKQAEIFHYPLDAAAHRNLTFSFEHLATEEQADGTPLEVEGRLIDTVRLAEGVVWFDFDAICNTPRSHADYIEISRCFHSVLVGEMPQLNNENNDAMRRFISLVDEFYERNVKLMIAAEVALDELYIGTGLAFEFKRTLSRLKEMQSEDYLAQAHLP
ncbi:cell division protein ZapE [Pleionea sp. CnH1-48]|uniref:cell division protein ZapE n=1 Tax=Pleionea sp. CnH1-48 TaxID=2954494 RepID=UPI002096FAEF|nr:cell division protein ZapE [Pleionea sp. CnH1-48]MCO7224019.1 cell division protein ZapE [Pleionea sp. CnH1-48]